MQVRGGGKKCILRGYVEKITVDPRLADSRNVTVDPSLEDSRKATVDR